MSLLNDSFLCKVNTNVYMRPGKRKHLNQKGIVVWLFGSLSGAGKTTISYLLKEQLGT